MFLPPGLLSAHGRSSFLWPTPLRGITCLGATQMLVLLNAGAKSLSLLPHLWSWFYSEQSHSLGCRTLRGSCLDSWSSEAFCWYEMVAHGCLSNHVKKGNQRPPDWFFCISLAGGSCHALLMSFAPGTADRKPGMMIRP